MVIIGPSLQPGSVTFKHVVFESSFYLFLGEWSVGKLLGKEVFDNYSLETDWRLGLIAEEFRIEIDILEDQIDQFVRDETSVQAIQTGSEDDRSNVSIRESSVQFSLFQEGLDSESLMRTKNGLTQVLIVFKESESLFASGFTNIEKFNGSVTSIEVDESVNEFVDGGTLGDVDDEGVSIDIGVDLVE